LKEGKQQPDRRLKLALAPMQDVTDLAFMRTLARLGSLPDVFVTPYFRSTRTTCAMGEENLRCILENETGVPIIAQLAGSEAFALCRDAEALLRLPVAGINLNAGCPSPLVNRHGAGAGLLRDFARFREVLRGLRKVVPLGQFSVKCRLAWESLADFPDILDVLCATEPDAVIFHMRTRKELYGSTLHWELLPQAVECLPCPVWGNGDITTAEGALQRWFCCEMGGLMIGRGAVRNPYIFRQLHGGPVPTAEEMCFYYTVLAEETWRILHTKRTEAGHCNRMKKYLAFCYPDFSPETEYALRRCTRVGDMLRLLTSNRKGRSAC